jgi:superfamily I DNA/RNA helicase
LKVTKGLEFPLVALPGVGHRPLKDENEQDSARVIYVVATRATQRLLVGVCGICVF